MLLLQLISSAVENGNIKVVEGLIKEAVDAGIDPNIILTDGMVSAMDIISSKFQAGTIFVPEMLIATKAMKKGIEVLRPYINKELTTKGTFIIGTVAGDIHDIGKNIVSIIFESDGFKVIDLGVNVPAQQFVDAVFANPDCKIVGVSSLLTTTLDSLKNTVQHLVDAGCKSQVRIMVGGAAVTQAFADSINADAYTSNAGAAVIKAYELISLANNNPY